MDQFRNFWSITNVRLSLDSCSRAPQIDIKSKSTTYLLIWVSFGKKNKQWTHFSTVSSDHSHKWRSGGWIFRGGCSHLKKCGAPLVVDSKGRRPLFPQVVDSQANAFLVRTVSVFTTQITSWAILYCSVACFCHFVSLFKKARRFSDWK